MARRKIVKSSFGKWLIKKLSQSDIERFCLENKTSGEAVLIVHSDDMAYEYCFPNAKKANCIDGEGVDVSADKYYYQIDLPDNSFEVVVCTGLLEHVPEPERTVRELKRILKKDGKVIVSASGSFALHNAPENYFQFTTFGIKHLFEKAGFTDVITRPSCGPFRTIAILIQRIAYQCKINFILKTFLYLLAKVIPTFDCLIIRQFGDIEKKFETESMLYSNVQLTARKSD